ncbi:MAG: uroporphyrinogen-III C-methyltransferase [Pseudotabrizicola sp.]|uniref:uroporphyrinogen-III C-methyltransferase n=1 Tax=Pseudotabrizicola sp. TaxID=2939647 RepID=UPI002728AC81|nr:uroporphyrinogen-III C-methyltransferase [Pseudotabrizicola sp.]MDO8884474.1 uroporphyrinogen-III C-methyltransferase [Pseudotabrizicola sp.]MDP2081343.1 uroporphyrinogen-III C-methyltransferase [Pseudotabrizicola sp.]MDZ7576038.1 uroporphyrinogen-III C-methyltransferase [Pseudotabrizicola sp.]
MSFLEHPATLVPQPVTPPRGRIALVGAGPGSADLLTLRAIRCLGRADVVFYDRLVEPEALDFVRPGAECVFVGKEVGTHSWPQARIDAAIVAAALQGKQVVRLKSGDPSIFGRASEEIEAARAHGIDIEIIAGVTAASAAAASLCRPLTRRGVTDRVMLATATCCTGEMPSQIAEIARPGTSLVFYMAMNQLQALTAQLLGVGVAADQAVTVATNVSRPNERSLNTTVSRLSQDCQAANVRNPAVILIELAKPSEVPLAFGVADGNACNASLSVGHMA